MSTHPSFFVGAEGIELAPFYDLVNIKMYPDFSQEMAMGLGDEFDVDTMHAYQLADFADSCNLPRGLVANRLRHLTQKLLMPWWDSLQSLVRSKDESCYLEQYKNLVIKRAKHLLKEADGIISIDL